MKKLVYLPYRNYWIRLFRKKHNDGNNGIIAKFVFPYICSFPHYLYLKMLANVKLDVSW